MPLLLPTLEAELCLAEYAASSERVEVQPISLKNGRRLLIELWRFDDRTLYFLVDPQTLRALPCNPDLQSLLEVDGVVEMRTVKLDEDSVLICDSCDLSLLLVLELKDDDGWVIRRSSAPFSEAKIAPLHPLTQILVFVRSEDRALVVCEQTNDISNRIYRIDLCYDERPNFWNSQIWPAPFFQVTLPSDQPFLSKPHGIALLSLSEGTNLFSRVLAVNSYGDLAMLDCLGVYSQVRWTHAYDGQKNSDAHSSLSPSACFDPATHTAWVFCPASWVFGALNCVTLEYHHVRIPDSNTSVFGPEGGKLLHSPLFAGQLAVLSYHRVRLVDGRIQRQGGTLHFFHPSEPTRLLRQVCSLDPNSPLESAAMISPSTMITWTEDFILHRWKVVDSLRLTVAEKLAQSLSPEQVRQLATEIPPEVCADLDNLKLLRRRQRHYAQVMDGFLMARGFQYDDRLSKLDSRWEKVQFRSSEDFDGLDCKISGSRYFRYAVQSKSPVEHTCMIQVYCCVFVSEIKFVKYEFARAHVLKTLDAWFEEQGRE